MSTRRSRRSTPITEMNFEERVAEAAKQATFAKANALFVHPVRTNRTQRVIGHFSSQVMQAMLPVHSKPERMALQILDLTIGVKQFWPQPETFEWSDGRRPRRYTPDCGVVTSNRRIMIEAKLEEDAEAVHNVEVRELSAPYLKAEGWELLLLTEKVLFHPDLLKNVRELRRRRNHPFSEAALRAIHHHLEREESMSFSDCAAVATSMGGDADMLYTAIGRRQLYCNLWEPLTPASPLIHAARAPRPFISELLGEN